MFRDFKEDLAYFQEKFGDKYGFTFGTGTCEIKGADKEYSGQEYTAYFADKNNISIFEWGYKTSCDLKMRNCEETLLTELIMNPNYGLLVIERKGLTGIVPVSLSEDGETLIFDFFRTRYDTPDIEKFELTKCLMEIVAELPYKNIYIGEYPSSYNSEFRIYDVKPRMKDKEDYPKCSKTILPKVYRDYAPEYQVRNIYVLKKDGKMKLNIPEIAEEKFNDLVQCLLSKKIEEKKIIGVDISKETVKLIELDIRRHLAELNKDEFNLLYKTTMLKPYKNSEEQEEEREEDRE